MNFIFDMPLWVRGLGILVAIALLMPTWRRRK